MLYVIGIFWNRSNIAKLFLEWYHFSCDEIYCFQTSSICVLFKKKNSCVFIGLKQSERIPTLELSSHLRYRLSSQDNGKARSAWVHFFTWHSRHCEVSVWPWVQEHFLKDKKSLCLKPLSKGPTRSAVSVWQLYSFSLLDINCFLSISSLFQVL